MLKNIDPSDKSIKPFKAFKKFLLTQNDSASGHFVLKAESGSYFNFNTGSAASQSFGDYIPSASRYRYGTFYDIPNWYLIKNLYYENDEPYRTFGSNNNNKCNRDLDGNARIFSVPRDLIGEEIKPGSVVISDTSKGQTWDIRDDGYGNLYDFAHSASFSAFKSSSFNQKQGVLANGSGSQIGNVFYSHGTIVITDTGSYSDVGVGTGYSLEYKSTQTIYEYEYIVKCEPNEYNLTTNISSTFEKSGSITLAEGTVSMSNFLPISDQPTGEGTGSYKSFYNQAEKYEGFVTHSEFKPYTTTIGLYNDSNELLVIGKLSKPLKLNNETQTSIVVRFDV